MFGKRLTKEFTFENKMFGLQFHGLGMDCCSRARARGAGAQYSVITVSYTHLDVYKRQNTESRPVT